MFYAVDLGNKTYEYDTKEDKVSIYNIEDYFKLRETLLGASQDSRLDIERIKTKYVHVVGLLRLNGIQSYSLRYLAPTLMKEPRDGWEEKFIHILKNYLIVLDKEPHTTKQFLVKAMCISTWGVVPYVTGITGMTAKFIEDACKEVMKACGVGITENFNN